MSFDSCVQYRFGSSGDMHIGKLWEEPENKGAVAGSDIVHMYFHNVYQAAFDDRCDLRMGIDGGLGIGCQSDFETEEQRR